MRRRIQTVRLPEAEIERFLAAAPARRQRPSDGLVGGFEVRPVHGQSRKVRSDADKIGRAERGLGPCPDGKDNRRFIERRKVRLAVCAGKAPGVTVRLTPRGINKLAARRYGNLPPSDRRLAAQFGH